MTYLLIALSAEIVRSSVETRGMLTVIILSLFLVSVLAQGGAQKPINATGVVYDGANFACNWINTQSHSADWFTLMTVANATVQVVSGEIFRMDIRMGDSVCWNMRLNWNANLDECPLRENALIEKYRVMVLYKHWEDPQFTYLGKDLGFTPEY